jgi:membrane protein
MGRIRAWQDSLRTRGERLAERAQSERQLHKSVDATFQMVDRDADLGGGIIAGALAYRLFIWMLPLALVLVGGLGIAADAAEETPEEAADSLGMGGLISHSIATAATGNGRWYALLIGIPILVYTTGSVLRVLIVSHRLLWTDSRARAQRATPVATLRLLVLLLAFPLAAVLASAIREWSPGVGILATALSIVPFAALWVLISSSLPHRDASWQALIPGALLFGVGVEALNVFTAYVLTPWALNKQGTYGALGLAAALLLSLFLISRLVVAAAVLNATLWERRAPADVSVPAARPLH